MNERRFIFRTAEEIGNAPADGLGSLQRRRRERSEGTGEPPPHADPGDVRGQQPSVNRRGRHRSGSAPGMTPRAREPKPGAWGVAKHPPLSSEPGVLGTKPLSWRKKLRVAGCGARTSELAGA